MRFTTVRETTAKDRYERDLLQSYGPKPINVFTRLRLSKDLTQEALAQLMFTSKQSLIRLEQGTYDTPLPVALDYWVNKVDIGATELSLVHQYEEFQEQIRTRHKFYFGDKLLGDLQPLSLPNVNSLQHPLVVLRRGNSRRDFNVSVSEVSKALCVPQATLQYWETKWRLQKSVPKTFQTALLQIDYPTSDVDQFNRYYLTWRQVKLGRPI